MKAIHASQPAGKAVGETTLWQKLINTVQPSLPAIGLAVIVLMVLFNVLLWRQLTNVSQQTQTQMRVVNITSTSYTPSATGTLIMDPNGDFGTLVVDNLSLLDSAHQYQVWLIQGGKRVSSGLFSVNQGGYASIELKASQPLIQYDSIGITIEPLGGSPGPTGANVLGGAIPH